MFRRVAIVGVGLIGGSLGMAMRQRGLAETVVGVGRRADSLEVALHLGAIDEAQTDLAKGVADCDLVVLATPVPQIVADIERLPGLISPDTLVTDVGSVKQTIVAAGNRYLPGQFVGSHPMAGSEKSGVEHARADLFEGAVWVATLDEGTLINSVRQAFHLGTAVGSRVVILPPDQHDRAVAVTSHLPHVLAYALVAAGQKAFSDRPDLLELAAGSWASATRVAHSSPRLWQEIALANRPALLAALDGYLSELQHIRAALDAEDADGLLANFERGHFL